MAKQTYKNQGGRVALTFAEGREPIDVAEGESVSSDDPEVLTALRKSGQFKSASSSSSKKESK